MRKELNTKGFILGEFILTFAIIGIITILLIALSAIPFATKNSAEDVTAALRVSTALPELLNLQFKDKTIASAISEQAITIPSHLNTETEKEMRLFLNERLQSHYYRLRVFRWFGPSSENQQQIISPIFGSEPASILVPLFRTRSIAVLPSATKQQSVTKQGTPELLFVTLEVA